MEALLEQVESTDVIETDEDESQVSFKDVPDTFTKNGFLFNKVERDGLIAIFSKRRMWKNQVTKAVTYSDMIGYEVVVLTDHPAYVMAGIEFPAGISFPSNEQWGTKGWTCMELEAAEVRYLHLLMKRDEKVAA